MYFPLFEGPWKEAPELRELWENKGAAERRVVMLVEDNAAVREFLREGLEDCGYIVRSAVRSEIALRDMELNGRSVDLLITDIVMPDMNGVDLARQIRSKHPDMRVLFMTGWSTEVSAVEAFGNRSDFIRKPFEVQELDERIRRLLSVESRQLPS